MLQIQLNLLGYNFENLSNEKKKLLIFKLRIGAAVSRSVCPVWKIMEHNTIREESKSCSTAVEIQDGRIKYVYVGNL